jgi:hypothetical protein
MNLYMRMQNRYYVADEASNDGSEVEEAFEDSDEEFDRDIYRDEETRDHVL